MNMKSQSLGYMRLALARKMQTVVIHLAMLLSR